MAVIKIKQGEDWVKLPNVGIQSGIADAPVDDKQYVRSNGEWVEVPYAIEEAPNDGNAYIRMGGAWVLADDYFNNIITTALNTEV